MDKFNSVSLAVIFVVCSNVGYWAIFRGIIKLMEIPAIVIQMLLMLQMEDNIGLITKVLLQYQVQMLYFSLIMDIGIYIFVFQTTVILIHVKLEQWMHQMLQIIHTASNLMLFK